ncbi:hypothetical protein [Streptomyces sp. NPDC001292]|uniref:hypothetical protein n=1 Tax=Streptomyces sp. NPDC001292 TaxID=3364558 RepID=UPI003685FBB4
MARTTTPTGQNTTTSARAPDGQTARTGRQTAADLAFLARAMKAPALLDAAERLAERAQAESWTPPSAPGPACSGPPTGGGPRPRLARAPRRAPCWCFLPRRIMLVSRALAAEVPPGSSGRGTSEGR